MWSERDARGVRGEGVWARAAAVLGPEVRGAWPLSEHVKGGQRGWRLEHPKGSCGTGQGQWGVRQDLEPAKGFEADIRKEEPFLLLVWEAGLASFPSFFPSDVHPDRAASGPLSLPLTLHR